FENMLTRSEPFCALVSFIPIPHWDAPGYTTLNLAVFDIAVKAPIATLPPVSIAIALVPFIWKYTG
ncbi:hypothetical protein ABK046_51080, partial [Streptomyces caeruleatus]